ncbi:serine O-acetyltransferase [Lactobacillus plantarum]|nr:serine O-acetyltransferase [Lactiplantibacillus plantarum]
MGVEIKKNSFGPGLYITHIGGIVINGNSRIGENCTINAGVNIGNSGKVENVPILGDNIWIGPGAKIFGRVMLANGIAIGANAVVNKTFSEENITIAGVPAKKVSGKGSRYQI